MVCIVDIHVCFVPSSFPSTFHYLHPKFASTYLRLCWVNHCREQPITQFDRLGICAQKHQRVKGGLVCGAVWYSAGIKAYEFGNQ